MRRFEMRAEGSHR